MKKQSAKQLLVYGEEMLASHSYDSAIEAFETLAARYPFGKVAEQGQLDIIFAYYKKGEYDSALASAQSYVHLYPRGKHVDYAYYMAGLSQSVKSRHWLQRYMPVRISDRDLSAMEAAFMSFNQVASRFPHSPYAQDAQQRMIYIRMMIAQHNLDVAKFYYDHHSYVAAINRARYVVAHLQGTPQVKPALIVIRDSAHQLGLTKMSDDAQRVIQLAN